jgi:hypothetical protein
MQAHTFETLADAKAFAAAGNAIITLQSLRTETHYTYRIRLAEPRPGAAPVYFVNLLAGGNADEGSFVYLGIIRDGVFMLTGKSHMNRDSAPVKAFRFFWMSTELHPELVVRHEGHCGRCGRTLTVPQSIDRGIGPECADKMGITL